RSRLAQLRTTPPAAGRDDPPGTPLARGLAHGHGSLAADLLLEGGPVGEDVALVDPDLDADAAEGGLGLPEAVVDIGSQGVQRHSALAVVLLAGHLRSAESARALDPDALAAGLLHRLEGPLHGPAEADPAGQLVGDALGDQGRVELRLLDLLDVELHLRV